MPDKELLLEIKDLYAYFPTEDGLVKAVDGVSLNIYRNHTLGVVGESGCGKSVTAHSILRILPTPNIVGGQILFHRDGDTVDLAKLSPSSEEMRDIRGREISMIFQEPMTAFSPVHTIGQQIMEAILVHETVPKEQARRMAIDLLRRVRIAMPERRVDEYPHQLSGGMRQRAMIAMALALRPLLLIADEPTTALDVTIQAQILRLMKSLQAEMGMSIMFITHNLGVIANMADEVAVMYLGKVVEFGTTRQVFHAAKHPYTQALLRSIPSGKSTSGTRLEVIRGTVPVPINLPNRCPFANRCIRRVPELCDAGVPDLVETEPGHLVRCVHYAQPQAA